MNTSAYIDNNFETLLQRLKEWLTIPSISSIPENSKDVELAAKWIHTMMQEAGFPESRCIPTDGRPLVYGEWLVDPSLPTLLLYGHYDVQPVDPIEQWESPPFEPAIRNNAIFGRGASDDKGQVFLALAAVEAWSKTSGKPPVNLKVLLEGEEEAGGNAIAEYVNTHPEELAADGILICDTHMVSPTIPSLITGLRGIVYTEVQVDGSKTDLHSGSYGGVAPNPLHAICIMTQRLKDEDGRIKIPELEQAIPELDAEQQTFWNDDPLNISEKLKEEMGITSLVGEKGYPPLERLGHRPTLELHGIKGGYIGEGAKTVIPATATAKLSMRLPGNLDPDIVYPWLEKAIRENMPEGYKVEVRNLHGGSGVLVDTGSTPIKAAVAALKETYDREPVFMREGGSIPIAALFAEKLNAPLVLMGFGLPDDSIHAPNEKFNLDQLRQGMKTVALFFEKYSAES